MTIDLQTLMTEESSETLFDAGIAVATGVGLPTTQWEAGSPTKALFNFLAETLATLEPTASATIAGGLLDYATGDWLILLAEQVFGYTPREANYPTCTVRLTNGGGGYFSVDSGSVTMKNAATGITYHNTSSGTLASGPGTTLDLDVVADEAGSDSSSSIGEIDTMVTSLLGVTCSNTTAAVGVDSESETSIRAGCRAKTGMMSSAGPADAYRSVALDTEKTTASDVTRVSVAGDTATGDVTVYLASSTGTVSGADRTLVEAAIVTWAKPLCITPTVSSASTVAVAITYDLWIYSGCGMTSTEVRTAVAEELAAMLSERPIGGDDTGYIDTSLILGAILKGYVLDSGVTPPDYARYTIKATLTLPAASVALTASQVATLGAVTGTIHFVSDPA